MRILLSFSMLFLSFQSFGQSLERRLQKTIRDYFVIAAVNRETISKPIDLGPGIVSLPGFMNKRTETIDSYKGELSNGRFVVDYDIGWSAGTHMHKGLKDSASICIDTFFNGYRTMVGLLRKGDVLQLVVTVLGPDAQDVWAFPANFWTVVRNEEEVKQTLHAALSYRKKPK